MSVTRLATESVEAPEPGQNRHAAISDPRGDDRDEVRQE
jgi:hypothetical protein